MSDLEHAFDCQEVGPNRSQVSKEFNVGVVEEIIDVQPNAQRQTKSTQFVRGANIDEFDGNALIAIDNRREANEVFVDSLNPRQKPEIGRSAQMMPVEGGGRVEEMTRTKLQNRVVADIPRPGVRVTKIG